MAHVQMIQSRSTEEEFTLLKQKTSNEIMIGPTPANGNNQNLDPMEHHTHVCKRLGPKTGIIFNSMMQLFTFHVKGKHSFNHVAPRKRGQSSVAPIMGEVALLAGAAGGLRIVAASFVAIQHMYLHIDRFLHIIWF